MSNEPAHYFEQCNAFDYFYESVGNSNKLRSISKKIKSRQTSCVCCVYCLLTTSNNALQHEYTILDIVNSICNY